MSLFQCEVCGCVENTALASQGCNGMFDQFFDWTGFEGRRGKRLCSACAPTKYRDGTQSGYGEWHGQFERMFLPIGIFKTSSEGNLEHVETGDKDYWKYAITGDSGE